MNRIIQSLLVPIAVLGVFLCSGPAGAGCSDEDYLKAQEIFERALKEASPEKRMELMELAFKTCPEHGNHCQGYYQLARLYLDRNDNERALHWLRQANRFRGVMLQRSVDDLAQTNLLIGKIYREKGKSEKALIHMNIYRALTQARNKQLDEDLLRTAESIFSTMYSPASVKEVLTIDKAVSRNLRPKLNRIEVYFSFDGTELSQEARKHLDAIGEALQSKGFQGQCIMIEGHTDETGEANYNCGLGQRRAAAVVDYLKKRWGIEQVTLVPVSYGLSSPAMARKEHARDKWSTVDKFNRRVVIWNAGAHVDPKDITVQYGVPPACSK